MPSTTVFLVMDASCFPNFVFLLDYESSCFFREFQRSATLVRDCGDDVLETAGDDRGGDAATRGEAYGEVADFNGRTREEAV